MQSKSDKPPTEGVNFMLLRQHYQKQFLKYLDEKAGNKSIYFDASLLKVLSLVLGPRAAGHNQEQRLILQDHTVQQPAHKIVIFAIRPDLRTVEKILWQKERWKKMEDKEIFILFVPRRTIECDEMIYQNNIIDIQVRKNNFEETK
jgi:hypothetical protein